jgi:hypothetical protein
MEAVEDRRGFPLLRKGSGQQTTAGMSSEWVVMFVGARREERESGKGAALSPPARVSDFKESSER